MPAEAIVRVSCWHCVSVYWVVVVLPSCGCHRHLYHNACLWRRQLWLEDRPLPWPWHRRRDGNPWPCWVYSLVILAMPLPPFWHWDFIPGWSNKRKKGYKEIKVTALNGSGIAATSVMNQLLQHQLTPSLHQLIVVNCNPHMCGANQEVIKALLQHKKSNAETGINYEPGMAILEATVESEAAVEKTIERTKLAKKALVICPPSLFCGIKGHKTHVKKCIICNPMHPLIITCCYLGGMIAIYILHTLKIHKKHYSQREW